jgi:hypothetical protein
MKFKLGTIKDCPKGSRPSAKGISMLWCLGTHNAGWFIDWNKKQVQIGMGHLSVLFVDIDIQVFQNQYLDEHRDALEIIAKLKPYYDYYTKTKGQRRTPEA